MSHEFDPVSDTPAIRSDPQSWPCPFCGGQQLIISSGDLSGDPLRIELYCNSTWCEVREFVVLAQRAGGHERRGDVQALEAIDHGTIDEQRAEGYDLTIDEQTGRVRNRVISLGSLVGKKDERDQQRLARRRRDTYVTVEPDSAD
ncbi:hypothetical protein ACVU7I_01510 [Patulibacter sp. S7RM1-6]